MNRGKIPDRHDAILNHHFCRGLGYFGWNGEDSYAYMQPLAEIGKSIQTIESGAVLDSADQVWICIKGHQDREPFLGKLLIPKEGSAQPASTYQKT